MVELAAGGSPSSAGEQPDEALFRRVGELASKDLEPDGDIHASSEYRKEVAAVVVRRALVAAAARMTTQTNTGDRA